MRVAPLGLLLLLAACPKPLEPPPDAGSDEDAGVDAGIEDAGVDAGAPLEVVADCADVSQTCGTLTVDGAPREALVRCVDGSVDPDRIQVCEGICIGDPFFSCSSGTCGFGPAFDLVDGCDDGSACALRGNGGPGYFPGDCGASLLGSCAPGACVGEVFQVGCDPEIQLDCSALSLDAVCTPGAGCVTTDPQTRCSFTATCSGAFSDCDFQSFRCSDEVGEGEGEGEDAGVDAGGDAG